MPRNLEVSSGAFFIFWELELPDAPILMAGNKNLPVRAAGQRNDRAPVPMRVEAVRFVAFQRPQFNLSIKLAKNNLVLSSRWPHERANGR